MNAIDLLKDDHRKIEQLFIEILAADGGREEIFRQIELELFVHADLEELIFYPAIQDFVPGDIEEALREHAAMNRVLAELSEVSVDDHQFDRRLTRLMELVSAHVREEESPNGILDTARRRLGSEELQQLGKRMKKLKRSSLDDLAA